MMWKLYVLPDRHGQGIGAQLLESVIALARRRGRPLVTEYVAANTAAGKFYASHGFEIETEAADPLSSVWMRLKAPRFPAG